jgi:transposase-like protein
VKVDDPDDLGNAWVFVAIDSETKLIPSYRVGKRHAATTYAFLSDLRERLAEEHRFQLSTDGLVFYYNFCRIHSSLRVTPCMEAGVTDHIRSLRELLS